MEVKSPGAFSWKDILIYNASCRTKEHITTRRTVNTKTFESISVQLSELSISCITLMSGFSHCPVNFLKALRPFIEAKIFGFAFVSFCSMTPRSLRAPDDITIIIGLDGILVNASPSSRPYSDFFVTVQSQSGPARLSVYKRPYVDAFLAGIASLATVFLFTASPEAYAAQMAQHLDPLSRYFSRLLTRKDCVQAGSATWRKEWDHCGTDLARTIIVVNDPDDFDEYTVNGIVVPVFDGDERYPRLPETLAQVQRLASHL
jgi:TFIIF-interacting CTD phosphatase-like protein